jgi:predicted aspartyl protease
MATLADGSQTIFDVYEATIVWNGREQRIAVDEAETAPLRGMRLLSGSEVGLQVWPGGTVTIGSPSNS